MTNREAIEQLEYIKTHHIDPEDYELFDLAIKALEEPEAKGDLISREALKENEPHYDEEGYRVFYESEIDNAPTVSEITKEKLSIAYEQGYEDGKNNWLQEERPQGEWIEDSGNIACSYCHAIWLYIRTDFCPNCGAKMKGGTK